MHPLLRPANFFILLSYAALSAIPFLGYLIGQPIEHPLKIVSMEFIAWLAVWGGFKRPAWFHWLLAPAFIVLPVELYLRTFYGQGISTHHLGIIAESSPREALEFLGNKIWLLVLILISVMAWWWICWKAARNTKDLSWNDNSRWAILFLLSIALGVWSYGYAFGVEVKESASSSSSITSIDSDTNDAEEDEEEEEDAEAPTHSPSGTALRNRYSWLADIPPLPAILHIPFETDTFARTWPFGFAVHAYNFGKERAYLVELANGSSLFKFGARQNSHTDQPQIIIMVIGESSRYDRWSINGYRRETSPLLKNESNLVSLSNVVTSVSATRLSVPILVSRKPATQSLKAGFREKSFLTAFKEAGFKTYWLSNQMSFGQFDTPVSVFANEAEVTQFLNLGGFTEFLSDPA